MNGLSIDSLPTPSGSRNIQGATDLIELGMYREALEVLDHLPEDMRSAGAARRGTLKATTALGQWKRVLELAIILRAGNEADRKEAAHAFLALAAEACKRGRDQDARKLIAAAVSAHEEVLPRIMEDERFPEKFRNQLG
jgi:lipopolysaccharide biosynthesis regulator YciM